MFVDDLSPCPNIEFMRVALSESQHVYQQAYLRAGGALFLLMDLVLDGQVLDPGFDPPSHASYQTPGKPDRGGRASSVIAAASAEA